MVEKWIISQLWAAVAEAHGQFSNPKEGEYPPLEDVTRGLVKTAK
jgi:hypothetical protein